MRFKLFLFLALSHTSWAQESPILDTLNTLKPGTSNFFLTYKSRLAHHFLVGVQNEGFVGLELQATDLESLKKSDFKNLPAWAAIGINPTSTTKPIFPSSRELTNISEWMELIEQQVKTSFPATRQVQITYLGEAIKINLIEFIPKPIPPNVVEVILPNHPNYYLELILFIDPLGHLLGTGSFTRGFTTIEAFINAPQRHFPISPQTIVFPSPAGPLAVTKKAFLEKIHSLPLGTNITEILGFLTTQALLTSPEIIPNPSKLDTCDL